MPEPTITYDEYAGNVAVERRFAIGEGEVCQYDLVGLLDGRPAGSGISIMNTRR